MIKIEHLRVGSYVKHNGDAKKLKTGSDLDLFKEYEGIPVTPDTIRLLGTGSHRIKIADSDIDGTDEYELFDHRIWYDKRTETFKPDVYSNYEDEEYDTLVYVPQYRFVHEIQNFYMVMYGVPLQYFVD